jgi:molybdopterin converting factor small subunit
MRITLLMTGRGYDATGELNGTLELPEKASVDDALRCLHEQLADRPLSPSCLVVHGGKHLGTVGRHEPAVLSEGDELLLIAPVAGG